jgi:hypothetical protein
MRHRGYHFSSVRCYHFSSVNGRTMSIADIVPAFSRLSSTDTGGLNAGTCLYSFSTGPGRVTDKQASCTLPLGDYHYPRKRIRNLSGQTGACIVMPCRPGASCRRLRNSGRKPPGGPSADRERQQSAVFMKEGLSTPGFRAFGYRRGRPTGRSESWASSRAAWGPGHTDRCRGAGTSRGTRPACHGPG